MSRALAGILVALLLVPATGARAGAYVLTDFSPEDPSRIVHPPGYSGAGGSLDVTLCIDPGSAAHEPDLAIPLQNVARTFTQRLAAAPNLIFADFFDPNGDMTNVPFDDFDFESVALHEIGHCLGLGHTNLGTAFSSGAEFAAALDGANSAFDVDDGADDVEGSADDLRVDDLNLVWFFKGTSNPFTIFGPGQVVDASTYSRDLADLASGDLFATSVSRDVAALLGDPDSEAVMKQLTFNGEEQRRLSADDVAALRMAMSGNDETQGTADDYSFSVSYVGVSPGCDIRVEMTDTGFARCSFSFGVPLGSHVTLASGAGVAQFRSDVAWFYNDVLATDPPIPALEGAALALLAGLIALTLLVASRRGA